LERHGKAVAEGFHIRELVNNWEEDRLSKKGRRESQRPKPGRGGGKPEGRRLHKEDFKN